MDLQTFGSNSLHWFYLNGTDHPELFRFHVLLLEEKNLCPPPSDSFHFKIFSFPCVQEMFVSLYGLLKEAGLLDETTCQQVKGSKKSSAPKFAGIICFFSFSRSYFTVAGGFIWAVYLHNLWVYLFYDCPTMLLHDQLNIFSSVYSSDNLYVFWRSWKV